jgi:hypothetical protein
MLGAYMTPETLNRHNSKWPEVKIFFIQVQNKENTEEGGGFAKVMGRGKVRWGTWVGV